MISFDLKLAYRGVQRYISFHNFLTLPPKLMSLTYEILMANDEERVVKYQSPKQFVNVSEHSWDRTSLTVMSVGVGVNLRGQKETIVLVIPGTAMDRGTQDHPPPRPPARIARGKHWLTVFHSHVTEVFPGLSLSQHFDLFVWLESHWWPVQQWQSPGYRSIGGTECCVSTVAMTVVTMRIRERYLVQQMMKLYKEKNTPRKCKSRRLQNVNWCTVAFPLTH